MMGEARRLQTRHTARGLCWAADAVWRAASFEHEAAEPDTDSTMAVAQWWPTSDDAATGWG